jgi:hypothetical protein
MVYSHPLLSVCPVITPLLKVSETVTNALPLKLPCPMVVAIPSLFPTAEPDGISEFVIVNKLVQLVMLAEVVNRRNIRPCAAPSFR